MASDALYSMSSYWHDGRISLLPEDEDLGPCCERCGCPIDPAFADRTDEGWLCMDCFELEQQERREAW